MLVLAGCRGTGKGRLAMGIAPMPRLHNYTSMKRCLVCRELSWRQECDRGWPVGGRREIRNCRVCRNKKTTVLSFVDDELYVAAEGCKHGNRWESVNFIEAIAAVQKSKRKTGFVEKKPECRAGS